MKKGVLLLAHGTANSSAEIPQFLAEILGPARVTQKLVEDLTRRYLAIGGKSSLISISQAIRENLEERLKHPVFLGMKYGQPSIENAVLQMADKGIENFLTICLAPHFSYLSIAKYEAAVRNAIMESQSNLAFEMVQNWHNNRLFLHDMAERLRSCHDSLDPAITYTLFSAHSLPKVALSDNDPYQAQVGESARNIAQHAMLPADQYKVCFQSGVRTDDTWLGPHLPIELTRIAALGYKNVVIAPIGYISEHLEINYDLDIEAKEKAMSAGLNYLRTPMFNSDPNMTNILEDLAKPWI